MRDHCYITGKIRGAAHHDCKLKLKIHPSVVGLGVLKPIPEKVGEILKVAKPTTKKEVRSFLGMVGYHRRFIPNFAAVAAPLSDLTKSGKRSQLQWEEAHDRSFATLKHRLATAPISHLPDPAKPFILRTYASDVGL